MDPLSSSPVPLPLTTPARPHGRSAGPSSTPLAMDSIEVSASLPYPFIERLPAPSSIVTPAPRRDSSLDVAGSLHAPPAALALAMTRGLEGEDPQAVAGRRHEQMLRSATDCPILDAASRAALLQEVEQARRAGPPADLGAAAEEVRKIAHSLKQPEDALRLLSHTLPYVGMMARTGDERLAVHLLKTLAHREPYEAQTVREGIEQGLAWLAAPRTCAGEPLACMTDQMFDTLNYWEDACVAAMVALHALRRKAVAQDNGNLSGCVALLQRADQEIDGPDERERDRVLHAGLRWLADNPVSGPRPTTASLRSLTHFLGKATESPWRDVLTGGVAATILEESATAAQDVDGLAEARLLKALAAQRAENTSDRMAAFNDAFRRAAVSTAPTVQRMGQMATDACESMREPFDAVRVARSCFSQWRILGTTSHRAEHAGLVDMGATFERLTQLPLYGDAEKGTIARVSLQAIAASPTVDPGTLAGAGRMILQSLQNGFNQRLVIEPVLVGVERMARAMGDDRYVPEAVGQARQRLQALPPNDEKGWLEGACAVLADLEKFRGRAFSEIVSAAARARLAEKNGDGRVQQGSDSLVIGGVKIPVRENKAIRKG